MALEEGHIPPPYVPTVADAADATHFDRFDEVDRPDLGLQVQLPPPSVFGPFVPISEPEPAEPTMLPSPPLPVEKLPIQSAAATASPPANEPRSRACTVL